MEAGGGVRELAPGLHVLGGTKGGRVRAFLVDAGGELFLVDTLFEDDARGVLDAIRRLGRKPSDLKRIALTHAHRSHLGGLAALKRETGATVLGHEWEADVVSGDRPAQSVGLKPTPPLRTYPFQVGIFLNRPRHRPCPVDEALGEEDAVGPLQVLHVPGHSPGHLAFFWPERRVLVAGDAIATWPRFEAGWPAFTLNPEQHRESIRRLAALEAELVGVGHGDPIVEDAAARVHSLAEPA
jgi:glyoxylase-like metal-dependent hydrolase (beta-lactamase superfamily II)